MSENSYFSDIKNHLPAKIVEKTEYFDVLDSTNNYLKRRAHELKSGIVIADCQTAGRGRLGRSFISPKGCGIYLSVLFSPDCETDAITPLTCCTAVKVSDAIYNICGVKPAIKWVNDLIIGTKKICGILVETIINPTAGRIAIIIGVGVNVNQSVSDFPEELRNTASSIAAETGNTFDRALLAAEIIKNLENMCENWSGNFEKYLNPYKESCVSLKKDAFIICGEKTEHVYVEDIDDSFGLIVRYPDGRLETIRNGEVSVRGLYGYT